LLWIAILIKSIGSEHHGFIPDFKGNGFRFSWFSIMFDMGLSYIAFIMFSYIPSIPTFIRVIIMKGYWILSKAFSLSIEMIKWFLSFLLLVCCITFDDLHILSYSCILGIELIWSWSMIFLLCCWIQFVNILSTFAFNIIRDIGL
jgi:hypothetical protein